MSEELRGEPNEEKNLMRRLRLSLTEGFSVEGPLIV